MFDALTPLRRAYGVEVPGATPSVVADRIGPTGAGGPSDEDARRSAETALLLQTRAAVTAAVAAQDRTPAPAVLASVLAEAARTSAEALTPLAAVRTLYGELATSAGPAVEAAILAQSRAAVEASARPQRPSEAAVAAVLARAAEASRLAPVPDAAVSTPAFAPLAVAYGLPASASAGAPAPVETTLLLQSRTLLDAAPSGAGPSDAVVAAILARAAVQPASRTAPARPEVAADRSPVRAARSARRIGAWASGAVLAAALVVALLPRPAGAPEVPVAASTFAEAQPARSAVADASDDVSTDSPDAAPLPADAPAGAPAGDLVASAAPALSAAAPVAFAAPVPPRAVPPPAPRRVTTPPAAPRETRPTPAPSDAAPAETALASASAPAEEAWDAPDDVRVLSLRLQELRRGNAGLGWDAPAEAFGAPTTGPAGATPGLRSVRETVPAGRARLRTAPDTGDR